jgi:hypothetical protein
LQRLLTTFVLVGLLVATAAAFAVTERLKLTKSPIYGTVVLPKAGFSPIVRKKATIEFKLRKSDDVTITILDAKGGAVRQLAAVPALRGLNVFRWDGRDDADRLAKDGTYRAEVHLSGQHRTIVLPNLIRLDTKPPQLVALGVNREAFSPDGDHQADFVRIQYEFSKPVHVALYLGGERILRPRGLRAKGQFSWYGIGRDGLLPPGSYGLQVGATDAAGNGTPRAQRGRLRVRLRYIELASKRIVVPAGERFSIGVSTDARKYQWKLGGRKSIATGPVLNLLASTRRGSYTLTVSERGHVARARVIVR